MDAEAAKAVILFISTGMRVLSARIVLLIVLCMTFGLFVWAMYLPTYERIATATIFTVLVFLPSIRADTKANEAKQVTGE